MKKTVFMMAVLAIVATMFAGSAVAQLATVKGTVKDVNGKPWANVTVEFTSLDSGRKVALKTNNKGEFFSLGVQPGNYKASLIVEGQTVFSYNQVPVKASGDNLVDFDMQKEAASANIQNEEAKKEQERVQKENEKIRGLNKMLADANAAMQAQPPNYDQAIALLQQATQADATKDILWFKLGDAYRGAKKYPESVEAYNKAIAIKPSGAYYNNLGESLAKSGKTDDALKAYEQAATAEPEKAATYYFNMGAVLTNTGKVDEATAAFDKVIAADPARADAYYWKGVNMLGKATEKGGKLVAPEGTEQAFNKYLELAPTGPFAEPAKQMLASIGATVETTYGKQKAKKKN